MSEETAIRITLAAVGSRGDVQPMLALAQGLVRRGHTVRLAAPPNFAAWSARIGLPFTAVGCDTQAWLSANPQCLTGHPLEMARGMRAFFGEQLPLQFPALMEAADGSEAIVCGGLALSAPSVAEYLGIPALAVAYSPCVIPGLAHPPPMVPWQNLPHWVNSLLWQATHVSSRGTFGAPINRGRQSAGMAPVKIVDHLCRQLPWLIATDRELLPPSPEWAQRVPYAGFLFYEDDRELDPDLEQWLAAGEPPLFVGFGSMSGGSMGRIKRVIEAALIPGGRRVLVGAGWGNLADGTLPEGWRTVGDVPHARLFRRVAAVIHHGGSGTMATALRAGVPQVLLPLILDQYHHAARLHRGGVAPLAGSLEAISAEGLSRALEQALAMDPAPRRNAAARLADVDGIGLAAERIERFVDGENILPPLA